ncbi:MAG: mechanosensitive ion channel, partial [Gemmatimonadota bacterium]
AELARWRGMRPDRREGLEPTPRRLTNVGTFRAYVLAYLQSHPGIHQDMTLLVRQLEPTSRGLPLQLYCFTRDTAWVSYENVQGDIFDHLLSMAPRFGLRVYQEPAGSDFRELAAARSG